MLNYLASACNTATYFVFSARFHNIISIVLPMVDLIVQLFICFICIKLGARDSLNRLNCFLIDDGNGDIKSSLFYKKVSDAICLPHAANVVNYQENDEINESFDNSFTRNETVKRDYLRGKILTNAKECNEICDAVFAVRFRLDQDLDRDV